MEIISDGKGKLQEESIEKPLVLFGRPPVPGLGDSVWLPQLLSSPLSSRRGLGSGRGRGVGALRWVGETSEEAEGDKEREAQVEKDPEARNPMDRHRQRPGNDSSPELGGRMEG